MMLVEEGELKVLGHLYGNAYREFQSRVPRLFPRFPDGVKSSTDR
jgi:protein-S-isoprenylcysteine O-methyltransferase Ste14